MRFFLWLNMNCLDLFIFYVAWYLFKVMVKLLEFIIIHSFLFVLFMQEESLKIVIYFKTLKKLIDCFIPHLESMYIYDRNVCQFSTLLWNYKESKWRGCEKDFFNFLWVFHTCLKTPFCCLRHAIFYGE